MLAIPMNKATHIEATTAFFVRKVQVMKNLLKKVTMHVNKGWKANVHRTQSST